MESLTIIALILSVAAVVISIMSLQTINLVKDAILELNIYNTIRNSRQSLMGTIMELSKFEKDKVKIYKNTGLLYEATIEDYVTTYNYACTQYLDKKVDQKRFKKNFKSEIGNLFENPDIIKAVNLNDRAAIKRYDALLEVYNEWFKTEE